jgi:Type IV secretion-system coupling protein DNA-binding domain
MLLVWAAITALVAGVYFATACSFEQWLYLKASLLTAIERGLGLSHRFTVGFVQAGKPRWAYVEDVVAYLGHQAPWIANFHALVIGSLVLALATIAALYGAAPLRNASVGPAAKRHLRGARVLPVLAHRPAYLSLRRWCVVGFVFSVLAWSAWMAAELPLSSPWWQGLLVWLPRAFDIPYATSGPAPRNITMAAGLVGYTFAAVGVLAWPMLKEGARVLARRRGIPWPRERLTVGGVSLSFEEETRNLLVVGRVGSGKTQLIQEVMRGVRTREARALIADPDGGYLSRFARLGDRVLNPFDARTQRWSPFAEIRSSYDYAVLATAIIPESESPNEEEWRSYARTLLAATLKRLHEKGRCHAGEVLKTINQASDEELASLYVETNAAGLTRHDAMFNSVVGVISPRIATWEFLPEPDARHPPFSIRDWVRNRHGGEGDWLYLTYRDDQREALQFLIATWLSLATTEGLSLPENLSHRLYVTIDELDSLGPIAALKHALTKLRKHGGVLIAGLQTSAQPRVSYGRDGAQILLSCFGHKVVLSLGDHETAQHFEEELGRREVERVKSSRGVGTSGNRGTSSSSTLRESAFEPVVLASELMGLRDRQGYLRRAGTAEILRIRVPLVKMPIVAQPFAAG